MVIAYCATKTIYHLLPTTLNSLLSNNSDIETIYLLIEDDDIPYIQHSKIKFINCNQLDCLIRDGINITRRFTYMALTRCVLSKILKEPKVLYLDVDTIIDGSIKDLWEFPMDDNLLAGKFEAENYCNSGVLLMDLKKISAGKYDDSIAHMLRYAKLLLPDQDAINLIYKDKIKPLPDKFNAIGRYYQIYGKQEFVIRHFAGIAKPWESNAEPQDAELWNKYCTTII